MLGCGADVIPLTGGEAKGTIASGLAEREVLVGCIEVTDTKLPRLELLDMAEGKLLVVEGLYGSEVTTLCLGLILAK